MAVPLLRAHPTVFRRAALGLLLLVAFILRIWNLNWDDGTHQHPDERFWSIVTSEVSAPGLSGYFDSENSTLNPYNRGDTWVYGTLPLFATKATASFLADGPFPAGAMVTTADAFGIELRRDGIGSDGEPARVDAFDSQYNANLVGRLLSALIDTGTVLLVYLLGRDLFDRRTGFVAATLLTFTALHIQYAHFYGAEPWVTFFVTAAVWVSLKMAGGDLRVRVAAAAGGILGLAMASKLIAVAALIVPAVAIIVAVAPAIAAASAIGGKRFRERLKSHRMSTSGTLMGIGLILASLVLGSPAGLKGTAVILLALAAAFVAVYSLAVIAPRQRHPEPARFLFDQDSEPQMVAVGEPKPPSPVHITVWGAFTALMVLMATLATYRVFQPYTFDGLVSIDPRFTNDLNYLEGVNSGGNVPWVVQWIGRTPLLFPLKAAFWWGMGPALGLAVIIGVVRSARAVVRRHQFALLVPLSFLAIMVGLVSQQFNPLIRYLLPAYPVAVALAAFGIVSMWDSGHDALAGHSLSSLFRGRALQVSAATLVAVTVFWGLAFVNGVYNNDHPRIEASVWMADNLPDGAVLSNQIWDDSLPLQIPAIAGFEYSHVALDPFQPDRAETKVEDLILGLDQVDYVVEASNRVYDSIPRVPAKYPSTTAYYEALFDGRLGFEQIAEFRTSPSLFGIDIPDHFAEETFTVYDHPTVTIWAKTVEWSIDRARAILNPAQALAAPDLVPNQSTTNALQLRPADQALTETGATFNETFTSDGLLGSYPWIWWLIWLELAGLAVLPWTTLLFARLPDKGYGLSKVIGLLTVGLGVWLTVSWDLADFGRSLTWVWFGAVALVGTAIWSRHAKRMSDLWHSHRSAWSTAELVFLGIFLLALWMRSANPDLWEPFLGGEKPMEMAYLTSIARAQNFPAADPWFAGGVMNYYYFGWFLLTVPMRALRVAPEIGFNLGVATYAALTASVAFSVVHNLVAISRNRWATTTSPPPSRAPARAGLVGVLLLMGIGNLDAIRLHYDRLALVNQWEAGTDLPVVGHVIIFLGGSWQWAAGTPLQRFDWWAPSRVNSGNFDITEFPYFTFLFGDLHPHLMGMAFVGLTVSLAVAYILSSRSGDRRNALFLAAGLGLITGVVRVVNTWDLPSVILVTAAAVVLGRALAPLAPHTGSDQRRRGLAALMAGTGIAAGLSHWGGPGSSVLLALFGVGLISVIALVGPSWLRRRTLGALGHLGVVAGVHLAVFWPFLRSNETFDTGLQSAVAGSPLGDFLIHWGIFIGLATALAVALAVDLRRRSRMGEAAPTPLPTSVWGSPLYKAGWLVVAILAVLVTGRLSTGAATISMVGVIVFGYFLLVEARRPQLDVGRLVAAGLFLLGFAIAGGVDLITVQNDIERMNTVFKFWLQSWQYFALAGGFAVWQVGKVASERPTRINSPGSSAALQLRAAKPWRAHTWTVMVGLLLLAGLAYPLLGTRTRLETRFAQLPVTLDGLAYLDHDPAILKPDPNDPTSEIFIDIGNDLALIEWIRENVRGTPAVVEWSTGGYDWNSRVAIYTGLPTVLGWDWHQKQQRFDFQEMVDRRLTDIRAFYTTSGSDEVTTFLQTYSVAYVIVGTQELRFGSPEALAVIAAHPALEPVFLSGETAVYRVNRDALWPGVNLRELDLIALGD